MIIITGKVKTEYGVTSGGNFFERRDFEKASVFRSTPDPLQFLQWMIQPEVIKERENQIRERIVKTVSPFWTMKAGDNLRGTFNKDLYLKIIEEKRNRGIL